MEIHNRTLFFSDNLKILQEKIPENTFDLIYLDPPFNSDRNYNVLFKEGKVDSSAQIHAFEDT
jgi:site-specific DNA-methyltransferase (adenine-specific)